MLTVKEYEERSNNTIKIEMKQEIEYRQITDKSKNKRSQILQFLPSVCFQYRFDKSELQLKEMIFNESFLHELGYSPDSFVTSVFREGLPQ